MARLLRSSPATQRYQQRRFEQQIAPTLAPSTTVVGISLAMPSTVNAIVGKSAALPSTVNAPVGKSAGLPYTVAAIVGKSAALPFTIAAFIGRSLAQPYTVAAIVGKSLVQLYTVAVVTGKSLAQPWADLVAVGKSDALPSTVFKLASKSLVQPYTVAKIVAKSLVAPYSIAATGFPAGSTSVVPFLGGNPLDGWNHSSSSIASFKGIGGHYATAGVVREATDHLRLVAATRSNGTNTYYGPLLHNPAVYAILANALPTGYDNADSGEVGGEFAFVGGHITPRHNTEYPEDEGIFAGVGHFGAGFTGEGELWNNALKWTLKSPHTEGSITLVNPGSAHALSISTTGTDVTVTLAYASGSVTTTANQLVAAIQANGPASAVLEVSHWQFSNGTDIVTGVTGGSGSTPEPLPRLYAKLYAHDTPVLVLFLANNFETWSGDAGGPIAITALGAEPAAGAALGLHIVGTHAKLYYSASGGIAAFPSTPNLEINYLATDDPVDWGFYDPGFVAIAHHHIADDFELFSEVGAGEYPPDPFPTVPFLDSFNRANSGSLGANWTSGADGLEVAGNKAAVVSTSTYYNQVAWWTAAAIGGDQAAAATIADAIPLPSSTPYPFSSEMYRGIVLRSDTANSDTGYLGCVKRGNILAGGDDAWLYIFKNTVIGSASVASMLAGPYPVDAPIAGVTRIGMRVVGDELALWYGVDGTLPDYPQLRVHDSTYTTGPPGLSAYGADAGGAIFDDFYAGEVSVGTPVGISLAMPSTVRAAVGKSDALPYSVTGAVGKSDALPYTVTAPVGKSDALPYTVATPIGKSSVQPWTDFKIVGKSDALPYTVRQLAGRSLVLPYDVISTGVVGRSLALPYVTASIIGRSLAQPWTDFKLAGASLAQPYVVFKLAGRSLVQPYSLVAAVGRSDVLAYQVLRLAGASAALPATVYALAGRSLAQPYVVRFVVGRSVVLPYTVAATVGRSVSLVFIVSIAQGRTLVQPYVVFQLAGRSLVLPYLVRNIVEPIGVSLVLAWTVRALVGRTLTLPWKLHYDYGDVLVAHPFQLGSTVEPQPGSFADPVYR